MGGVQLKPGEAGFTFTDGYAIYNRAAIEVSQDCPQSILKTIELAVVNNWIKPIAYLKEEEYTWVRLSHEGNEK